MRPGDRTTRRRHLMVGALIAAGIALVASAAVISNFGGPSSELTTGRSATSAGVTPSSSGPLPSSSPTTTNLSKVVVNVSLTDSGEPMGRGKGGYSASAMHVRTDQATVPHGTVTFRVTNSGVIEHEMLILPLGDSQSIGTRPFGGDAKVDEAGKLHEASHSEPKVVRSVTLTLAAGRYELVCNHPGHYVSGMYTLLTVT